MKKTFSILLLFSSLFVATSCAKQETIEKVNVITEYNEIIDEVEVEVPVFVDYDYTYNRLYKPGTYTKVSETEEGVATFVTVVIDKYGFISGIHVDNTNTTSTYKYDEETNNLYLYVEGLTDQIPNSYRLVKIGEDLPSILDSINLDDLVVGYPEHDEIIEELINVETNETNAIFDYFFPKSNSYSSQMEKIIDKVIEDQTTYGINLYNSGNFTKAINVSEVSVDVADELNLIQGILNTEANLEEKTKLEKQPDELKGLYKPGSYYGVSDIQIGESGVYFNTAFVVVDNYGEISGVRLDETSNNDGATITNWSSPIELIDNDWIANVSRLEENIVRNQSISSLIYLDENNKNVEFKEVIEEVENNNEILFSIQNYQSDFYVNNFINAFNIATELSLPELTDGVYYNYDDFGNIITLLIEDSEVSNLSIDKLTSTDQTHIMIKDEKYPLFTYEKGFGSNERVITYIYEDNGSYKYLNDFEIPKVYESGDIVHFDYAGYDESETVKPVRNNTSFMSIAIEEQSDSVTEHKVFQNEIEEYIDLLIGSDSPYVFDFNLEGKISNFQNTINLNEINNLVIDTFIKSTDKYFEAENIYEVSDIENEKMFNKYKLGNGSYHATSDNPSEDGSYFYLSMIVTDNKISSLIFDEIIYKDGILTTKTNLDDEYLVSFDDGLYFDNNSYSTYNEEILKYIDLDDLNYDSNTLSILENYDYELKTDFDDETKISSDNSFLSNWDNAFEKVLLNSLQARVTETLNDLTNVIEKKINNNFVVQSEDEKSGELFLGDLTEFLVIGNDGNEDILIDYDLNSLSNFVNVEEQDNVVSLTSKSKNVLLDQNGKFILETTFDDYSTVNSEFEVKVLSDYQFKQMLLDSIEFQNLGLSSSTLLSSNQIDTGSEKWFDSLGNVTDYINSTGNSLITLNYEPSFYDIQNSKIVVTTEFSSTVGDVIDNNSNFNNGLFGNITNGLFSVPVSETNNIQTSYKVVDDKKFVYEIDYFNNQFVVDNVFMNEIPNVEFGNNFDQKFVYELFSSPAGVNNIEQKVYSVQIFYKDELVHNYVPFKNVNGHYTLIDLEDEEVINTNPAITGSSTIKSYKNGYLLDNYDIDSTFNVDRIENEDINNDIYFTVTSNNSSDLKIVEDGGVLLANFISKDGDTLNQVSINRVGNDEIITFNNNDTFIIGNYLVTTTSTSTLTKTELSNDTYAYSSSNISVSQYNRSIDLTENLLELLYDSFTTLNKGVSYKSGTLFTAVTIEEGVIGRFTIKSYFDNFEEDEQYLYSYQKGSPCHTVEFDVYDYELAVDYARKVVNVGNVKDDISKSVNVQLSDNASIGIIGLNIDWSGNIDSVDLNDNLVKFDYENNDKDEFIFELVVDDGTVSNEVTLFYKLSENKEHLYQVYLNSNNEIVEVTRNKLDLSANRVTSVNGDDSKKYGFGETLTILDLVSDVIKSVNDSSFYKKADNTYINIVVSNILTEELNLNAKFSGSGIDSLLPKNNKEITIKLEKTDNNLSETSVINSLLSKFIVPSYVIYGEDIRVYGTTISAFDDISIKDDEIKNVKNVEIYWRDSNNRPIIVTPGLSLRDVIVSSVSLKEGERKELTLTANIYYEYYGENKSASVTYNFTVLKDRI